LFSMLTTTLPFKTVKLFIVGSLGTSKF
jgi:hypothetical protein